MKFRAAKILAFWGMSLLPLYGQAQDISPRFRHLTIDDGLSQSAVYALLQDRQGFVWIGTKDGLNQYDGYSFTVYKNHPSDSTSLSNNYITALFEDRHGFIWVGTREGGLNRLDPTSGTFRRYAHAPENPGSISSNRITAITGDSSGALWIGTRNDLNRLTAGEVLLPSANFEKFFHDPQDPHSLSDNTIEALLVDDRDDLWIGTANGLNRLSLAASGTAPVFVHYFPEPGNAKTLMDAGISSLYQSRDGSIWAGTVSGLNRLQPGSATFQGFPHRFQTYRRGWGTVHDIEEDGKGRLWLATPDELMIFDPARQTYQSIRSQKMNPLSLSSNRLTELLRDRSGVIWVGTNGYGLNLHDPKADRFFTYRRPRDFPSRIDRFSITALLEDRDGSLWISADVLYRWNRRTGELISFETDSDHPEDFGNTGSWSMLQDSSGSIWLAGFEGVYRYDPSSKISRHFAKGRGLKEKLAFQVYPDRQNRIWVATENYFSRYDAEADRFVHYRYRENPASRFVPITDVHQDETGAFWLATDDGLARFDPQTGSYRYFRNDPHDANSLANNVVLSITPDPGNADILWLGTAGGGLNRFNRRDNTFRAFTEADGLPNNVVYAALPDKKGHLWLSTNRGLSRFNPASGAFRNFDISNGLQSNEFNTGAYFLSPSGEMFFGGIKGLNYFFPENIVDNPHIANVVFTRLRLFNQKVSPQSHPQILDTLITHKKSVNLSYRANVIAFEFSALDFSAPSRNRYAYRMWGFDDRWILSGTDHQATYTNLPAGDYLFQVKGSNNDGVWNEQGATLAIHISAPPWKSWWAYFLYALAGLSLLYGIRRYEMNRIFWKNRLQMERVEGGKLRELDQLKSRFFANISHEFRTPLTLILGPIQQLMEKQPDEAAKHSLRMMQRNATRLLSLINQLLDLAKLDAGKMEIKVVQADFIPFLRGIVRTYEPLAETQGVRLTIQSDRESISLHFERDKLEKVFHNLLANALKFTPKGGRVSVAVAVAGAGYANSKDVPAPAIEVTISDTGPGIPAEQLPRIFDRFYQVENRDYEGTGIGLALAKELVELHHGQISVHSVPGQGSAFTVTLPLGRNQFRAEEIILPSAIPPASQPASLSLPFAKGATASAGNGGMQEPSEAGPEKKAVQNHEIILVIDDNADLRSYIRQQLQGQYRVLEAADGATGVELAREAIPDLVISDVMMPKMDGYDLCRAIKTDAKTSHIPIILLTARAEQQDKLEGLQTGADAYLTKPFDADELLVRVRNLIDIRRKLRERFSTATTITPREVASNSLDQQFLENVIDSIETHLGEEDFGIDTLCREVAMSERQLRRKLRALINQSPARFIRTYRLQRANRLLQQGAGTVSDIAFQVGFGSTAYFSKCFREQFGVTPSEMKMP